MVLQKALISSAIRILRLQLAKSASLRSRRVPACGWAARQAECLRLFVID
jgi:hypothetical protein